MAKPPKFFLVKISDVSGSRTVVHTTLVEGEDYAEGMAGLYRTELLQLDYPTTRKEQAGLIASMLNRGDFSQHLTSLKTYEPRSKPVIKLPPAKRRTPAGGDPEKRRPAAKRTKQPVDPASLSGDAYNRAAQEEAAKAGRQEVPQDGFGQLRNPANYKPAVQRRG